MTNFTINYLFILFAIIGTALCIAFYIYHTGQTKLSRKCGQGSYIAYRARVLNIIKAPVMLDGFISFYVECSYKRHGQEYTLRSKLINIAKKPSLGGSPDVECDITVFVNEAEPSDYYVEIRTKLRRER